MQAEVLRELNKQLNQNKPAVLVTILQTHGSSPRKAGSQMLVRQDGSFYGSIGGGSGEAAALKEASKAFTSHQASILRLTMNSSVAAKEGMACGGSMEIFIQPVSPSDE